MLTRFRIEHTECDYKREVEHTKTKSWLKSVSAFANGIGGMLIFGIDDEPRKPSPIADDELILKGTNRTWDTLKSEFEAKDFSFTLLESVYYNKTGNHLEPGDYLSFGLVTKDGYLTNAGALFTDISPFRQARIFCTRWNVLTKAPSSVDALDDKEYSGNILQLLNDSEGFIKLHNQKIWYKTADSRVEKENFPERAIHELMVNALVHRDYGVLGSEIHIDIFDDRIEIQNPGGMYDGVPVQNQDLENIISTRRNPVIADLMNRMDFMERRGSGFRKILAAVKFAPNYRKENLPVFKSTPFSFTAIVKNLNFLDKEVQKIENVPVNVPVNERQKMILECIKNGESYTAVQFAQKLGVSDKTIKRDFQFLSDSGLIKHIGSDKSGKWVSVEQ